MLCAVIIAVLIAGCGKTQVARAKVESGVINQDYSGTVSPVLPQDYKIKEEAKEGMIKVTIKCGVEKEIPIGGTEDAKKSGDSDEAKPKI
jgi:type IV secretory pathway TrbF-like protein